MSNSSNTPNLIPITDGVGFVTEADSGIIRFVVGTSRHAVNWCTGKVQPLKNGELLSFPLTHPNRILKTGLANAAGSSDPCVDRNPRPQRGNAMKRFSIDPDNHVTVLTGNQQGAEGSIVFHSEQELREAVSGWPAARLTGVWNGLTGVAAVRKFKDRATGISRIWKQIQSLEAAVPKAPGKPTATKSAANKAIVPEAATTKKDAVLALLRSPAGATLSEIMAATDWQKHSVRGFLSGAVHKKMGLTVLSSKNSEGQRVYRLKD